MNYADMSMSDAPFAVPIMSSMGGYDVDFTSEFLSDDAFAYDASADLNFVPTQYSGHGNSQDHMASSYMNMDPSLYMAAPTPSYNRAITSRPLTPPPDEEFQQLCYSSGQMFQDQPYMMDDDFTGCDALYYTSADRLETFHISLASRAH